MERKIFRQHHVLLLLYMWSINQAAICLCKGKSNTCEIQYHSNAFLKLIKNHISDFYLISILWRVVSKIMIFSIFVNDTLTIRRIDFWLWTPKITRTIFRHFEAIYKFDEQRSRSNSFHLIFEDYFVRKNSDKNLD